MNNENEDKFLMLAEQDELIVEKFEMHQRQLKALTTAFFTYMSWDQTLGEQGVQQLTKIHDDIVKGL